MRIAALDDKKEWIEIEKELSKKYCADRGEECFFVGYYRVEDFLTDLHNKVPYDVFLLDVEMPEKDGLSIALEIKKKYAEPIIIYISDFPEYAPRGYEVNAYRYILKKEIREKLSAAYDSLQDKIHKDKGNYYVIMKNSQYEQVLQQNIYYIKKEKKYVLMQTEEGEKKIRKTLAEVYAELDKEHFMFIDKGCIVNLRHIVKMAEQSVKMRDETHLQISRPRLKETRHRVLKYWGERL